MTESDDVHAWLERMRDLCDRNHPAWTAVDWLLGDYERRADADLTLSLRREDGVDSRPSNTEFGCPEHVWAADRSNGRNVWTITASAEVADLWEKHGYEVIGFAKEAPDAP